MQKDSVPYELRMASSPGSIHLGSLEITGSNHFTIYEIRQAFISLPKRTALISMKY